MTRAWVRVAATCDNRCRFCAQADAPVLTIAADPAVALGSLRAAGHTSVGFVGGEPLAASDDPAALEQWVAAARGCGFEAIGVQTHGRASAMRWSALVDAGVTDVQLSLHGARVDVHDYHTDVDGSFVAAVATAELLRRRGVTVVVRTVLTRSNFRVLAELPAVLARLGVAAWRITVPHATGRARTGFDHVVPRLGLSLPFALHALDRARRAGVGAAIEGAPACLLGPMAAWSVVPGETEPRVHAPVCAGCAARPRCVGVDAHYLARFGGDELRGRDEFAPQPAMPVAHAEMFGGVGAQVVAADAAMARPSKRLPIAGKAVPGREETRTKAAPDAAQGLFAALFDDADRE